MPIDLSPGERDFVCCHDAILCFLVAATVIFIASMMVNTVLDGFMGRVYDKGRVYDLGSDFPDPNETALIAVLNEISTIFPCMTDQAVSIEAL